jgi:hypothetical protein
MYIVDKKSADINKFIYDNLRNKKAEIDKVLGKKVLK